MSALRHLLFWFLLVGVLAAVAVWATREELPVVTAHTVGRGVVEATVANTRAGTVNAHRRAKLAPSAGGQVERLLVKEGDRVQAGEIGLLRAIGATRRQLRWLFLGEAATLAAIGGAVGLLVGVGAAWLLHVLVPAMPVAVTAWQLLLAAGVSLAIGLVAGVLPALRAARLDPIEALRAD